MPLLDRRSAGEMLGDRLREQGVPAVPVIGMARGGVPVAAAVARALGGPLDIAIVRKLGLPRQPELAVGAIAEGGVQVLDTAAIRALRVSDADLDVVIRREQDELSRRAALYRSACPAIDIRGAWCVLVDDGIATGLTALAAAESLKRRGASTVTLAAPVAAAETIETIAGGAIDDVFVLDAPPDFRAVGLHYRDFPQVTDDEVLGLLGDAQLHGR